MTAVERFLKLCKRRLPQAAKQYNLGGAEFYALVARAAGRCEICRRPFLRTPSVDHDHKTGRVRGLLCPHCNSMLGFAKDQPETLEAAARYLRKAQ